MTPHPLPIREFAELFDGPHATPPLISEGPIFLGIKNITPDGALDLSAADCLAESDYERWTRRVIPQPGDVVFTYEATLHRYALIPEGFRGCLGRRTALVRVDRSKVDPRYLYYYFRSPKWRQLIEGNILSGATVDRISLVKFPDFPVALPPLTEQRSIADLLDDFDKNLALLRRQIGLLEETARLIYTEWFVQLRFPGQKARTPAVLPEGWKEGTVGSVLTLQRGFDLPADRRTDGSTPIIASTGVCGTHATAKVSGPGVVTGRSGTLGHVHLVLEDFWPLNTTLWVREYNGISPYFAYFVLQNLNLASLNVGASVPTLDRNTVHPLEMVIPDSATLKAFDETVKPIFEQIRALNRQITATKQARDLLLPRLISGRLRL